LAPDTCHLKVSKSNGLEIKLREHLFEPFEDLLEGLGEPVQPRGKGEDDIKGDLWEDDVDVHIKAGGKRFDDEESIGKDLDDVKAVGGGNTKEVGQEGKEDFLGELEEEGDAAGAGGAEGPGGGFDYLEMLLRDFICYHHLQI